MGRSISYVVALMLLIAAVFLGDLLLTIAYLGAVAWRSTYLGEYFVAKAVGGKVEGVYDAMPYRVRECAGGKCWVTEVAGLHVLLANPNAVPVEVVLVGEYPAAPPGRYRVLTDLIGEFGIEWVIEREGVKVIDDPRWFRGVKYAVWVAPHEVAEFIIPSYWGIPSKLYACTQFGCVRLSGTGAEEVQPYQVRSWILPAGGNPPPPRLPIDVKVWYEAYSLAGPVRYCVTESGAVCGQAPLCCTGCPPSPYPGESCSMSEVYASYERGICDLARGAVVSPSAALGLPPNVLAGYFSDDPGFSFHLENRTVSVGPGTYVIHGLVKDGEDRELLPSDFKEVRYPGCRTRVVELTYEWYVADPHTGQPEPLSEAFKSSSRIYIYVAGRGYDAHKPYPYPAGGVAFLHVKDVVQVSIGYVDINGRFIKYRTINFTANVIEDNERNILSWFIPTTNTTKIVVKVTYFEYGLQETQDVWVFPLFPLCFQPTPSWWGSGTPGEPYCGETWLNRPVHLAYYVEIIPSEWVR